MFIYSSNKIIEVGAFYWVNMKQNIKYFNLNWILFFLFTLICIKNKRSQRTDVLGFSWVPAAAAQSHAALNTGRKPAFIIAPKFECSQNTQLAPFLQAGPGEYPQL